MKWKPDEGTMIQLIEDERVGTEFVLHMNSDEHEKIQMWKCEIFCACLCYMMCARAGSHVKINMYVLSENYNIHYTLKR
jgi:hypothetical protein